MISNLIRNLAAACLGFLAINSFSQTSKTNKLGLIISIGNYDTQQTGWRKIASRRDIPLIKGALEKLQFSDENISILRDSMATHDGILSALEVLKNKAKTGDMVVIHVSSHGQQISDNNGTPDEFDGYDEAIVCYGAPASDDYYKTSKYDGRLHLRDDEFGLAIDGIRHKLGSEGQVLVILDACCSETGTRSLAVCRGGLPPYNLRGVPIRNEKKNESSGFGAEFSNSGNLARFVVISGASANQGNFQTLDDDGKQVGSLSYCFSKALPTMEPHSTYRQLFAKIASKMAVKASHQTPFLEGSADMEIFGNAFIPVNKYFDVDPRANNDSKHLTINGGQLMNIYPGTTVIVRTAAEGTVVSTGTVESAEDWSATIALDKELQGYKPIDIQVFLDKIFVKKKSVKVSVRGVSNSELKIAVVAQLDKMGLAEIDEAGPEVIVSQENGSAKKGDFRVNVTSSVYNNLIDNPIEGDKETASSAVADLIQNYAQSKIFKELELSDHAYKVTLSLIPCRYPCDSKKDTLDLADFRDKSTGIFTFPEGSYFWIGLKNEGQRLAYINILSFDPGGKMDVLIPPAKKGEVQNANEFALRPKQSVTYYSYRLHVSTPYGIGLLKVLARGSSFDLKSVINTKGAIVGERKSRGFLSDDLESLLASTYKNAGVESRNVKTGSFTFALPYKIVKKVK